MHDGICRFDRELLFPLPNLAARQRILEIHTRQWARPPSDPLQSELAALCVGYCGADLKVLACLMLERCHLSMLTI